MGINLKDKKAYSEKYLVIRDKKQKLRHLHFKTAQQNLYDIIQEERAAGRPVRLIVLKGRQEGISTVSEGLMFADAATKRNVHTQIVAHTPEATTTLFEMNKLFYDCLPRKLQPMLKNSNAKKLVFENPTRDPAEKRKKPGLRSAISCVTANDGIGRSQNFNNVHLSEFAFWKCKDKISVLNGIMQAVPNDVNTTVIIESTANGYNEFQTLWEDAVAGENGWRPVFLPWYLEPEYRMPVMPGTEWTEEEQQMAQEYGLDEEQLTWRRWCIRTNCGGSLDMFRQEYPNNPDEAFLMSGESFFNNSALQALRRKLPEPARVCRFQYPEPEAGAKPTGWTLEDNPKGIIRIWKEPEDGHPYVIGGDTAGEGSDCFTACVIDNSTGEQVAELQTPFSEIEYARQIYCLGHYYNTALVGLEINFSTYPEMKLEEWSYPRLYQRERFDTFKNKMVKSFGWVTSPKTRPVALAELHRIMDEEPQLVRSTWLIGEMIRFVYDEHRKPQAADGAHDDLVMAAAITYSIRTQQRYTVEAPAEERRKWTADMWQDYRQADPETRRYLTEIWGQPE